MMVDYLLRWWLGSGRYPWSRLYRRSRATDRPVGNFLTGGDLTVEIIDGQNFHIHCLRHGADTGYGRLVFEVDGQEGVIKRWWNSARCHLKFGGREFKTATEIEGVLYDTRTFRSCFAWSLIRARSRSPSRTAELQPVPQ